MIAVLISFQAIEISYTDTIQQQHLVLSQPAQNTFAVIKYGKKISAFFEHILSLNDSKMEQQVTDKNNEQQVFFVCFSPKNKKATQEVFKALSQRLQNRLIYYNIDKNRFGEYPFNRPIFVDNQICFGQGFSQLRTKQELRIALASHLKCNNLEYIFIQKNPTEIKQLKKQGFTHIIEQFDQAKFLEMFQKAKKNLVQKNPNLQQSQLVAEMVQKHPFASKYFQKLYNTHKQINVKMINPFSAKNLTIQGMINQLFVPSTYYNISPKSWISNSSSREIVSYIFHNLSDQQLYLAKTSRPKDLSNEQDFQIKILTYYLTYLINPQALCVPHDKNSTLIKFSKIKAYENKKAFLNIRPYIQGMTTISQLGLKPQLYHQIFTKGSLCGRKVHGVAGLLLFSLLINQNLSQKTLSEQTAFVTHNCMNQNICFMDRSSLEQQMSELFICRTDYHNVFNMSSYKIINDSFIIDRQLGQLIIKLNQISTQMLQEMCELLFNIHQQTLFMIKNFFIYYRWNTKMVYFYDLINYRLNTIRQLLRPYNHSITEKQSLLLSYPRLACLLIPQNYQFFLLPPKDMYFPYEANMQQPMQSQKTLQNPYLAYMNKACSFAIFKLDFPSFTFLQWVKSTSKYHIIQYMSMINKTLEQYIIMDKRLKLSSVNDKKNVILIVDHAQLYPQIINKPKGVKTVMIYRLRKPQENEDIGLVGSQVKKKEFLDQSEDELIKVLIDWGSKILKNPTKLQLFDWTFQSYIRIKCEVLNLSVSQGKSFLSTLHRAISTNKHRLKQLQQNHRKNCNYLYTFPILKESQKIQFNYHLFEYLHMKMLFNEILQNKWNCRLQTYQNGSVILFRPLMDIHLIKKVVRQIVCYLRQIGQKKLASFQYKTITGDCLQLVRSLTHSIKNQVIQEQVKNLYYQVFAQIKTIKNYNSILHCSFTGDSLCVVGEQTFEIMDFQKSLSRKIQNTDVLAVSCQNNRILMLNFNRNICRYVVEQLALKNGVQIQCQLLSTLTLQTPELVDLLSDKKYRNVRIQRVKQKILFLFLFNTSLIVISVGNNAKSQAQVKQFSFSQPLIQTIYFINDSCPYVICATLEQVSKINLDSELISPVPVSLLNVNFGITNLFATQTAGYLHVFLYKLHVIEHSVILNDQVISKVRYQLNRNIKILTFSQNLLYVFYQNDDSLDIFRIKTDELQKIWTYYWVQPNPQSIYPVGDLVYLKSWNYVKQIRLKNTWTLINDEMSDK